MEMENKMIKFNYEKVKGSGGARGWGKGGMEE